MSTNIKSFFLGFSFVQLCSQCACAHLSLPEYLHKSLTVFNKFARQQGFQTNQIFQALVN